MHNLPKFISQVTQYRSLTARTQLNQMSKPPKLNFQKTFIWRLGRHMNILYARSI